MPTTETSTKTTPDEISQTFWAADGEWINDVFVPLNWHFWNVPRRTTPVS